MADRPVSALPAAESQDLVDTALFHLVNTLRPDLSDRNRQATAAQLRALLIPDGGIATAKLADDSVTNDKLRESAGLSVIGRGASSTGNPADLVAATDGHVLRRSGSSVGFGQIGAAALAPASVGTPALGTAVVTGEKLAVGAVGSASTFAVGISTFTLAAGAAAAVPAGFWYVSLNTPADMRVEVQQALSGSWGALSSGDASAVHLVISDGASVRVRNVGAVSRSGSRRQVFP